MEYNLKVYITGGVFIDMTLEAEDDSDAREQAKDFSDGFWVKINGEHVYYPGHTIELVRMTQNQNIEEGKR